MFEFPLFLLAAFLGAAIPLVLHLAQSRRSVPAPFPTLRFLKLAHRFSARRARMEHLLLWLLRTMIMALLGIAFAMPVLRSRGWTGRGRAARDIAIVLDASYSMAYEAGDRTAWARAIDAATALVGDLGENDRFCLFLAREQPRALVAEPVGDREAGRAMIEGLQPSHGTSRLVPAIAAAYRALRTVPQRRQREVHVLTDNQALAWAPPEAAGAASGSPVVPLSADFRSVWTADANDRDTAFFLTFLGAAAPVNATVRDLELVPPVLFPGRGGRLHARLAFSGPPRETAVSLFIGGTEAARRSVRLGTAEGGEVVFAIPALPPGIHEGRLELPRDNLPVDDAFHFLVRVHEATPALVVGSESDTFFLRAALRASAAGGSAADWVRSGDIPDGEIEGRSCIFLCNALPLPGQTIAAMERFVERGGVLVIFPGLRAEPADYAAWRSLPGIPTGMEDVRRSGSLAVTWTDPRHPLVAELAGAPGIPTVTLQRRLAWDALAPETRVLAMAGGEHPLLLERPFGGGRVLMFSVGAERSWSNLPLTPLFLPIVAQVEYRAGLETAAPFLWGGENVPLASFLPDAGEDIRLLDPHGQPVPLRITRREGQPVPHAERMTEPGLYRAAAAGREAHPVAAVNLPRAESDLAPVSVDDAAGLIGGATVRVAEDLDALHAHLEAHRIGRAFGEGLLWVVLLLVGIEFACANRLARGTLFGRGGGRGR